jgi:hypothetical protein
MPNRFNKLISTIHDVCLSYNKELVVRTFLYEPIELEWVKQGLLKSNRNVIVQSKCVPHDWDPYYPHNPLIGAFPENRQIVEFDCSSEFTGKNRIPYTSPEYFAYRWHYGLQTEEVVGYNARLDHGGFDALYTQNEINVYTLHRLTENPDLSASDIWKEWITLRYNSQVLPYLKAALAPSFEIVNKSFFPLKFWITNHSILPSFKYADGHISSRTLAKWIPDNPYYKEIENRLNHPDPELLEMILAEKDSAIALAEESLHALVNAKPYLTATQYDDLYWRFFLLHRTAIVWKLHAEAFFGYKLLQEHYEIPGLEERVARAISALHREAEVSEKIPGMEEVPPTSAVEIKEVAAELNKKLISIQALR